MADTIQLDDAGIGAPHRLRVGYVLKRYPRFSETFVVNEVLAHEQANAAIDIFALRPPTDAHFQDKLAEVRAGVTYLPDGNCRATELWPTVQRALHDAADGAATLRRFHDVPAGEAYQSLLLAEMVRARGIEHLHAHFATSATTVARMAAELAEISFTFTAHAKDIFHEDVDPAELYAKMESAHAVITVSDFNLRHLCTQFPGAADRVRRIYNGLDLADFPYSAPTRRPPRIVAVGRLVAKKGFDDLIRACSLLAGQGVGFQCEIIGEGDQRALLERLVAQLSLGGRVRLMGPRPRSAVVQAMQSASAVAAPCVVGDDGNRDGLPTVLLEAMALGTPCVSTCVTGIPELIRQEHTGLLASQRSPHELADALARLLCDAALRDKLATNSRKRIEEEFDVHRNTARQREVFRAAIRQRTASKTRQEATA